MSCNIKFNSRGEVEQVLTDQGTPSQLYAEAKNKVGEKEALEIFYVSQSDEFKSTQVKPTPKVEEAAVGNRLFSNPLPAAMDIARQYMTEKGMPYTEPQRILKVDESRAKKIADEFSKMRPSSDNEETQKAYKAMVDETIDQFKVMQKNGYRVEINNSEPYTSSQAMIEDLRANKRIKILSTESEFGNEPITDEQRKENPLLVQTEFKDANGVPLLANDLFRAVHDFFGHAELGNGFGAVGEENAWNVHARMYSPLARRAMTTETRAQNSWTNFSGANEEAFKERDRARDLRRQGKIEEANALTKEVYEKMQFAEQKMGLLPEWVSTPDAEVISPENSSNYANLTEDGKGNFVFYHRGGAGYETIKKSTGSTLATSREEGAALGKVGGVAMYYTKPTDSESMVSGATTYMVKVPMEKVYDFNSDSLHLIDEAKALHAKEHPTKAFDANTQVAYITRIAGERGYDMVVSEWAGRTRAQTTKEFTPIDTEETSGNVIVKPFKTDYKSNTEKGFIASIPKSKDDSLHGVYVKMEKERNAKNKYDNLYRLHYEKGQYTQNEITQMVMESDLSNELKQEYQDILTAPVKKRESFKVTEPALEDVMQFITAQNESKEPMTETQTLDYKNALLSVKDFSFENLKKAFYDENGVFLVVSSKLVKSGLYTQYEAEHLQKDLELQERVKASVEALKNTEEVTPLEGDFDLSEKENEFTSFGKLNNLNPYIVQKQIQQALAGTTREEFDEALGELPFSNFQKSVQSEDAKDKLFNDMQAFKKAEVMLEVDGLIKPSLNANTEVVVSQVAQDLEGTKVLADIKYFLGLDVALLKNVLKDSAKTLTQSIEKGLIAQGYDVIGLSAKAPDVYMMEYLSAVADLSEESSRETFAEYVNVYNKYFEQDLSPARGFIKTSQDDRNFVKLNTELREEDVYNQQGLIKQSEGVYLRVNKKTSDELYPVILTYPEKLPNNVKTEEDLKKYVQSTLNNDEVSDTETGETINLFKLYYGIPLESETVKEDTTEFNQKQAQFTGKQEYLTKDFVGDFYRDSLKEKAAESKAYKDFYRHFKVTEKGLELENNDPITLESIRPYITEDLQNYSLLSKSMPNLKSEDVEFVDGKNSRRNMVVNYPSTVAKFDGNISILDNNTLVAKNVNDEFIKLKNDVFENVKTIGNLTLYTKLATPRSNFLNFNVEAPKTDYMLEDYLHLDSKPESFIKSKNYLSKEEKNDLDSDEFACL